MRMARQTSGMSERRKIHNSRDRNARLALLDGWWERSVVHSARVGVVGVGALGNEILKNLALLDFRSVLLVDRDTVEMSNLSRSVLFRPRHEGSRPWGSRVTGSRPNHTEPTIPSGRSGRGDGAAQNRRVEIILK
jgi:ThiF family